MIAKTYRLSEHEVGKVLRKRKPFFSYRFVANTYEQKLSHPRFSIILSGKVTKGSVVRNFFRRRFFDFAAPYLTSSKGVDVVVVAKKWIILDPRNPESVAGFDTDIQYLFKNLFLS